MIEQKHESKDSWFQMFLCRYDSCFCSLGFLWLAAVAAPMYSARSASLRLTLAKEKKQERKEARALRIAALQDKDE